MSLLAAAPFLNPGFLWITAALSLIPLIIYLLNRQRHRSVPWAAMRFLLSANHKSIRRTRVEQLVLLVVRTLVVVLLGMALARPFLRAGAAPAVLRKGTHHVFVLDNSLSMHAAADDPAVTEPARSAFQIQAEQALLVLQNLPAGDLITVITAGEPARALNRTATSDRSLALRLIQNTRPGEGRNDMLGALTLIAATLDEARDAERQQAVYVFSDFAGTTLEVDSPRQHQLIRQLGRDITASARLVLFDVHGAGTGNVVNAELALAANLVGTGRTVEMLNTVRNLSTRRCPQSRLQLRIDDQPARELIVPPLDAGRSRTFSIAAQFDSPGWHTVQSTLQTADGDMLGGDNTRRLVLNARRQVAVLMVDGKPGGSLLEGQVGYLATAIAPRVSGAEQPLFEPTIISEDQLHSRDLSSYALILLCNVRRLPETSWQLLEQFVNTGGGVMFFLGDLVDTDHYNRAGRPILPAMLEDLAFDMISEDRFVKLDPQRVAAPFAADFAGRSRSGLFSARFHQYVKLVSEFGGQDTLLSFTNGDIAAVGRPVGAGRCVLVATTANMDWTNLPAKGDFVTLILNLVRYAAPPNAPRRNLLVGDTFIEDLGVLLAGTQEYLIRSPDGNTGPLEIASDGQGFQLRYDQLDHSGFYTLQTPQSEGPIAINAPPSESDLTPLSEQDLRRILDCEFDYRVGGPTAKTVLPTGAEWAAPMIYTVLMLLLIETLLAMRFGHREG